MERAKPGIDESRRKVRAFPGKELQILAHRIGHDQDVGKQDRTVEAIAPDRLQGDLGRRRAVIDQRQEAALLFAQGAVFRQIAPGLAHQPDRPWPQVLAKKGAKEQTGHRGRFQSNTNKILKRIL